LPGGVILVCAEVMDPMSARKSAVARIRLFMFLTLCKSGTDGCQQLSTQPAV